MVLNRNRIGRYTWRDAEYFVDQVILKKQGYESTKTVIYQDNRSTILLGKHGKMSSSKRTKHIDICYFYVTDKVKKGDVKLEYCPTDDMIADYFTKPLQGKTFKKLQKAILNIDE